MSSLEINDYISNTFGKTIKRLKGANYCYKMN